MPAGGRGPRSGLTLAVDGPDPNGVVVPVDHGERGRQSMHGDRFVGVDLDLVVVDLRPAVTLRSNPRDLQHRVTGLHLGRNHLARLSDRRNPIRRRGGLGIALAAGGDNGEGVAATGAEPIDRTRAGGAGGRHLLARVSVKDPVAGDGGAVGRARGEGHASAARPPGLGAHSRGGIRRTDDGDGDVALGRARRVAQVVVEAVGDLDGSHRVGGDRHDRPLGVHPPGSQSHDRALERERGIGEGVDGTGGDVHPHRFVNPGPFLVVRRADVRLGGGHDLDGDGTRHRVAVRVGHAHSDASGRASGRALGRGHGERRTRHRGADAIGDGAHRVGEGRGVAALGIGDSERQVLGDGLAPGLDAHAGRGEGGRLVLGRAHPNGYGQAR